LKTKIIRSINELGTLETGWNDLLEKFAFGDVGYSFNWFHNWSNSFLEDKPIHVVALEKDERLLSVLPLYKEKIPYLKLKMSVLKSMTNWHSHRFDLLADQENEEVFSKTIEAAFKGGKSNVIVLNFVPKNSNVFKWIESSCKHMNWNFVVSDHSENFQVKEATNYDSFFEQLDGKFRRNMRAVEKKAQSMGNLSLKKLSSEDEIAHFLEKGFAIEASGWKGTQGTAITCNQTVQRFYEGIAKDLFKRGQFDAYLLSNETYDLAFFYCIKGFGVTRALKIGSNENFRNFAPGMLITIEVLKQLHEKGNFNVWDFCGGHARWKKDWGNHSEKLFNVAIYNNNFIGKSLYKLGTLTNKYVV
jgi:CelD/BcsL family acetyltransferase involved in cellulose biosynthesis